MDKEYDRLRWYYTNTMCIEDFIEYIECEKKRGKLFCHKEFKEYEECVDYLAKWKMYHRRIEKFK